MFDGIEFEHALDRSDHPALLVLIKHKIAVAGIFDELGLDKGRGSLGIGIALVIDKGGHALDEGIPTSIKESFLLVLVEGFEQIGNVRGRDDLILLAQ